MSISTKQSLNGIITSHKQTLIGYMTSSSSGELKGAVNITVGAPIYDGELCVTPSAHNPIILETAQKIVPDNVTVEKIPYSEVSNTSNGTTVTIG